jgi:hypothetical protein
MANRSIRILSVWDELFNRIGAWRYYRDKLRERVKQSVAPLIHRFNCRAERHTWGAYHSSAMVKGMDVARCLYCPELSYRERIEKPDTIAGIMSRLQRREAAQYKPVKASPETLRRIKYGDKGKGKA